jgi:hypothetical protein
VQLQCDAWSFQFVEIGNHCLPDSLPLDEYLPDGDIVRDDRDAAVPYAEAQRAGGSGLAAHERKKRDERRR